MRYMERPIETHMQAVKRVLRYVRGTNDRKSTSGYMFNLSSSAVSWSSKKQPIVTLSTIEAEFIATASTACQAMWLRRILEQLNHGLCKSTVIHCDNTSAIKLSKNPVMHGRSKHIDVRFHFLRNLIKDEVVELLQCSTQEQVADILTKPLRLEVFMKMRSLMGVCEYPGIN
ncbi:hypothetical protein ACFX2K_047430 [Malus domestica]